MTSTPTDLPVPPVAPRRDLERTHHGDTVVDPYEWLRDADDPAVRAHLEAENAYAEAVCAPLAPLRERLFDEIRSRTRETDLSVPVAYRGWWYYGRTREGSQYGIQCRVPVVPGEPRPVIDPSGVPPQGEQVLVDGNVEAGGGEFFALGACEVDLSGERVALAIDRAGDERFAVSIRRIDTGEVLDESVTDVGYGLVWSADGRYVFYTRVDEAWRPHQVWRHEVGASADGDVLVFSESDERFWMGIGTSRDDRWMVVGCASKNTSEVHLLDLEDPTSEPRCVAPRREGVEYDVEPAGDVLFVTHNADRPDFDVAVAPLDASGADQWRPWLDVAEGERVLGVDAFAGHVVVSLRSQGLTAVRVVPRSEGGAGHGTPWDLPVDEPVYSIGVGANPEWGSAVVQVVVESLVTPRTIMEFDVRTRESVVLKRQEVLGGYDPSRYVQRRTWARASDGTRIPVSVVARADAPTDGTAPGILYAYGAYEVSMDPWFSIPRLSLLDRGVVFAVAHVRGGGEMGRAWYEQGRLEHKENTFTDVVACAAHLVDEGLVASDRLALEGGSAGGLMAGAVLNLAPERFVAAHAAVPFVDALTTILDPTQPLTVPEWEEWGDPLHDPAVYARMKGYSPYENVRAVEYPAILATTGLNDTRVSYAEPAKWVARLREVATNDPQVRPVLLRTEIVAGHGGPSGRYDAWRQYAWENAFLLHHLGIEE